MNKTVETTAIVLSNNNSMPVTKQDLEALSEKRKVLKDFVKKELNEGINGDFAIIDGTKTHSLLKPGAEKLCQLFGLRSEINQVDRVLDHNGNFAMFTYKATIYHIRSGEKISECEASCNSKEKKYATKSVWKNNVKTVEETPIYDIMNTLMKMAQKRALVGAVISATGASDFFTQDIDDAEDAIQLGVKTQKTEDSGLGAKTGEIALNFCVSGDTVNHKDTLKAMGGRWNMNDKRWDFVNSNAENFNKANSLDGLTVKRIA